MKKIGIPLDDYKVERYTKALEDAGLVVENCGRLMNKITLLRILCEDHEFEATTATVKKILKGQELNTHRSN